MENAKQLVGSKHFTLGELVDLGRRLRQEKLEQIGLLSAVQAAETEAVWRLQAAIELLTPLTHKSLGALCSELEQAKRQLTAPTRGQAKLTGGMPGPGSRSLPSAGTLLIRPRYLPSDISKIPSNLDGGYAYKLANHLRFLVVEPPCKLLWLDEPGGPIYSSPSLAASTAMGSSVNGWEWFGVLPA